MFVILVDSFNLAFRAHHTHSTLCVSGKNGPVKQGTPTGALFGFLTMVKSAAKMPDSHFVFCWEGGYAEGKDSVPHVTNWRKSIKSKIGSEYKANRTRNDHTATVHSQVPLIYKALNILGYPQLSVPGLEGDDIIGVVSSYLLNNRNIKHIYILSTDRDFFQCSCDKITVLRPQKGTTVKYTPKKIKEEFDVTPDLWPKYKALAGDSTDGYKGIKGIGPKNAAELVNIGADPSASWDDQPEFIKKEYGKLKPNWKLANDCWVMANIPRIPTYKFFPRESRNLLTKQLSILPQQIVRNLTKEKLDTAVYQFTRFCGSYEMMSLVADRNAYFNSVRLRL